MRLNLRLLECHKRERASRRRSKVKYSAQLRGISFSLTVMDFERYEDNLKCYYCGGTDPKGSFGLDRKNNKEGYTTANCVRCCNNCNILKGALLTEKEMKKVVALLKRLRKIEQIWLVNSYRK